MRSLITDKKEEDEQLELLESKIWLNFVLSPEDTQLSDAPQNCDRFRATKQTLIEIMLHLISKKYGSLKGLRLFTRGLSTSIVENQGCALRKYWRGAQCSATVKSRVPSIWFVWKSWDFLVRRQGPPGSARAQPWEYMQIWHSLKMVSSI